MSSYVFNSYISAVNSYTGEGSFYNPAVFDLWLCPGGISMSGLNYPGLTLADISYFDGVRPVYMGNLGAMGVATVGDDGLTSPSSYQAVFDIPASAYAFSTHDCPVDTYISRDASYTAFDYSVMEQRTLGSASLAEYGYIPHTIGNMALWSARSGYFDTEYMFASGYDTSEYLAYDCPRDSLVTQNTILSSSPKSFYADAHNSRGAAVLVARYDGPRMCDVCAAYRDSDFEGFMARSAEYSMISARPVSSSSGESIPCVYAELPKDYTVKNAVLNIQWSENGIFSFS